MMSSRPGELLGAADGADRTTVVDDMLAAVDGSVITEELASRDEDVDGSEAATWLDSSATADSATTVDAGPGMASAVPATAATTDSSKVRTMANAYGKGRAAYVSSSRMQIPASNDFGRPARAFSR